MTRVDDYQQWKDMNSAKLLQEYVDMFPQWSDPMNDPNFWVLFEQYLQGKYEVQHIENEQPPRKEAAIPREVTVDETIIPPTVLLSSGKVLCVVLENKAYTEVTVKDIDDDILFDLVAERIISPSLAKEWKNTNVLF